VKNELKKRINNIGVFWEGEQWGGTDTLLSNLINTDAFKEINVVIFTNKKNLGAKRFLKNLKNKKVDLVYFNSLITLASNNIILKILLNLLKPISFLISIFQFYFILRNYKFQVFIGMCGGYGNFRSEMASIFIAKFLGFPVRSLVVCHACTKPIFWNTTLNLINNLLSKFLTSVISISKATRETLFNKSNLLDRSLYSDLKNSVIYCGVPISQEVNVASNIDSIIYKDSKDVFLLGMLSRIESYKGQEDLIKGFSKLPKNTQNKLKIYFIGDGSKKEVEKLKKLISINNLDSYFIFTGYIDCESTLIVSKLDLLVSLTRTFEGFGLSIVEAMSVGTPVLATKVGAITEYLNQDNSKLVDASNIEQITNALNDFVTNKNSWDKKTETAKNVAMKNFTSEIMANNYLNHFIQNL
jgi:glycosyltransferase involved in cell wall biosynthesis